MLWEYRDPYIVHTTYFALIDSVGTQMQESMKQVLDNQAVHKAAHVVEK